ncbi:Rft-1-domain-containing protein [Fistulina hepatica ATCC 64428]|uniref:Man(5)GlcNAc(2)-PP-dolichol translocation protein RFT1 n=1 Tax=Fistulina hepatica ATCC 64428 TaxID=1128425 RepID=A0A0D7AAH6_9AGAR|nr:Rft-1-domain-containing protein [Fistulina hepatica ATCC 64428]
MMAELRTNIRHDGNLALTAFGAGQLSHSCALLLIYISHYDVSLLRPTKSDSSTFLTESDEVILYAFSPLEDQGSYVVAVNYGSLLARIVFQLIEQTLHIYFSKTLSASNPATATHELSNTSKTLLWTQILLSTIFVTFAPPYVPLLLNILFLRQYHHTSICTVLSTWVWYIPSLSVIGGLEAFVSSVVDGAVMNQQSRYMAVISPLYIASALLFYKIAQPEDRSLVYANMINLAAHIIYALHFTWRHYAPASIQVMAVLTAQEKTTIKMRRRVTKRKRGMQQRPHSSALPLDCGTFYRVRRCSVAASMLGERIACR